MSNPGRVLMVCTGNICRSPFLERALQSELDRSWGAGAVEVRSAGTGALVGSSMEPAARSLLESNGYSAEGFVARQLHAELVAEADLVLTATRAHRGKVAALHPKALQYVFSFREFADLVVPLGDGLPDAGAAMGTGEAADHLRTVVMAAKAQRGTRAPLRDDDADIVDPYRQPQVVFDRMATQIMEALPIVARALGRA
ncbi:low molecular weight phosphatase family protein [Pedococcus sp.]|uniref:arsenate reductase/protein-tyrosine-phosphatase family protein n=1 Tax=Pedococcus sp. TaxID=2860345 RepID=UPI002E135532|nr:low molecular weight phosphatase family protein [Pedococcus sp.]